MNYELLSQAVLVNVLTRSLVAKGILSKEDLLAELSRVQLAAPKDVISDLQSLILNLPNQ